jgi:hypothetical protein
MRVKIDVIGEKNRLTKNDELPISECVVAFDPSYIKKSGKKTFGLGMYWSGCSAKAKWGLDSCGFAVVDILQNTAFHLNAIQTPRSKEVHPENMQEK